MGREIEAEFRKRKGFFIRLIRPFRSRKVRVGLTTVIVAVLAEWKFDVSPEIIMAIVAAGVSVILGIAHEDNGIHTAAGLRDRRIEQHVAAWDKETFKKGIAAAKEKVDG